MTLSLITPTPALASELTWSVVSTPLDGTGFLLVPGSDIKALAAGSGGTVFAAASGPQPGLYRLSDGSSWALAAPSNEPIVAVAADGINICYATAFQVFRSSDGGHTFSAFGGPDNAGSGHVSISALAISASVMLAGTRDDDSGQFGGVYLLDAARPFSGWQDTNLGARDVYAVAFSPGFSDDHQLVAVAGDEVNLYITTNYGAGWGANVLEARLSGPASCLSASIAFADDYSASLATGACVQYVAVDSGAVSGGAYAVRSLPAPAAPLVSRLSLPQGLDVSGLVVSGPSAGARILAGDADSAQVYLSRDGGANFGPSLKPPSGGSRTILAGSDGDIYAGTSGDDSAVSVSPDGGSSWSQVGLIDSTASSLVDMAVSPAYDSDGAIFLITWGDGFGLWRRQASGGWQRLMCSQSVGVEALGHIALAPGYGTGSRTVCVAGTNAGQPSLWTSTDGGQSFARRDVPLAVDSLAVAADGSALMACFDGSSGVLLRSNGGGPGLLNSRIGAEP